jgi:hypothetical protein
MHSWVDMPGLAYPRYMEQLADRPQLLRAGLTVRVVTMWAVTSSVTTLLVTSA